MQRFNLIKYSDNYSKTPGNLWQYYRNELSLNNAGVIFDFPDNDNNNNVSFKRNNRSKTGQR